MYVCACMDVSVFFFFFLALSKVHPLHFSGLPVMELGKSSSSRGDTLLFKEEKLWSLLWITAAT